MPTIVASVLSTFDNKGLKKGKKEISAFDKNLKNLGKTFGKVFAGYQLLAFSKKAITAFAADEKAAKALELQLKNVGYAFSAPDVEYYIANLQKMYGILDDELRPAFQTLLTASGSITKSQVALSTALNISAATGKSVQEVSQALAKGYSGQTTALSRLGAGLSKATLASGDMNKIMAELDQKFAGQAAARLDTYAGKMDQLKVIAADATEIIGKGLLDALAKLSGDTTLSNFSDYVDHLATNIAKLVSGLGRLGSTFIPGNMVKVNGEYRLKSEMSGSNFKYSLGAGAGTEIAKLQEKKKIKEAIALRSKENALLKGKTAVDQLKEKFDVDRIGLQAALAAATDDETKLRLKALIAIQDNDEAAAKLILAQMNAAKSVTDLAKEFDVAGLAVKYFRDYLNYRAGERGDPSTMTNVPSAGGGGGGGGGSVPSPSMTQSADYQSYRAGERGDTTIQLQLGGTIVDEVVLSAMLRNQKNGRLFDVAGGL